MEWLEKWKSRFDVERQFSPTLWGYASQHPDKAYRASCPTLLQYDTLYGDGSSAYWVEMMVTGLFGSSASREKGNADGIRSFCQSFAGQTNGYKLSELMLFFARYRAGKYDNSYASFNARRIGNAFFKEFLPERNRELDKLYREAEQEAIESHRFIPPSGHTSLSYYQELKRRAEAGDPEAKKLLTPPCHAR